MRNPLRAAERFALAAILAFATATCTDQPTGPGGEQGARVHFTPILPSGAFAAGIPLDNITVIVVRPAAETLAVVNTPFDVADSVLQLDVPVTLLAEQEDLQVTIQLSTGVAILFQGTDTIPVSTDPAGTTAPPIALTYVGPGATIAFLSVTPHDTVLSLGDTLVFGASASDALENPVAQFYLRWWTTPAGTPIRSDGRLIAPLVRGTVMVHAWTPSGEEDSTRVTFIPVPTQLLKSAGDGQSDTIADTLPNPLVVQVKAADNLGVQGIPVSFAAVTAGGSVVTTNIVTDSLGFASTQVVLGDTARTYSYTATVAGLTPVTFTATATAGLPAAIAKQSGDAQTDTAGQALPQPLVVRVTDASGNPVTGAKIYWTRLFGTGAVSADSTVTAATGLTQINYTLNAPGTDSIQAQIAGTGAAAVFTATSVAGGFSIVEISGNGQVDTVGQTLPVAMVAEVHVQGSAVPAPAVWVQFSINYGGGSLSVDSALSDSLGRVQVTYTLDTLAGYAEVMAETPTAGQYVTFQVLKLASAPAQLNLVTTPADTQRAGIPFTPVPVIEVRDQYGNPVKVAGTPIFARTEYDLHPPAAPPIVDGVLHLSGGVAAGDSAVTDTLGRATFTGLMVDGSLGPEIMHFFGDTTQVPMLDFAFTIAAGTPASVIPWNGNGQTAFVDSLVAIQPLARVVDGSGNFVAGVEVVFVVTGGGGSVTGDTVVSDSLGFAQVGSWRLGSAPGPNTLEAQVAGASPAVFSATAQPLAPSIQLTLLNTNVVGVGRTATLLVKLSRPDSLGTVVSLFSTNPGVVQLDSSSTSYGPVDTVRFRILTGVSAGNADIIASAPGYDPDTLTVTGSLNLITLPTTSNVAFGQTASLPVQLALPAPAGGVTVSVTSLDPSKVSVVTPTVTFNAGEQLKNATVSGVAIGSAPIVAEEPNYAPDTSLVSTTAALNVVAASLTTFSTLPQNITVEFRSGGALIPAPAGGIVFTPSPVDAGCIGVPAADTIAAGQVSTTLSVGWGGSTALPCTSKLYLTAPGIDPDSVNVTVNGPPTATLGAVTVGAGLQSSNSLTLQTGSHGGTVATIKVLQTGIGLVSKAVDSAGVDSIQIPISNGTSNITWYVQGVDGVLEDTVLVQVSVPGFVTSTAPLIVRRSAFELASVLTSTTTLSTDDVFWVNVGVPNLAGTFIQSYQARRVGAGPLTATVTVSPSGVVDLKDLGGSDSIRTVQVAPGISNSPTSVAAGGLATDPVGPGSTLITATIPGFLGIAASTTVNVSAPVITASGNTVGAGLQVAHSGTLGASAHGGVTAKIRLLTPGVAALALNDSTPGVDSILVPVANGQTNIPFYLQGLEPVVNDSVLYEISAPGFVPDTAKFNVRRAAVEIASVPGALTTLSASDAIWANIGVPNAANTFIQSYQNLRAGATPVTVTFTATPSTVGTLTDSSGTLDTVRTAVIKPRQVNTPTGLAQGGVSVKPLAAGSVGITASIPGFVGIGATGFVTVSAPVVTLGGNTVGAGLQVAHSANLGAGGHGGVTATVRLLGTGTALVAPNASTVGSDSIQVFVANGQTNIPFVLQGVDGVLEDTVDLEVTAPGFVPDTAAIIVRRAAIELASVATTTTTLSADDAFWVNIGVPNLAGTFISSYQNVRAGSPGVQVAIVSSAPTVARLVLTGGPVADTAFVVIPAGSTNSPTSVATGGVALDPLTTGATVLSATSPGILPLASASASVSVNTPAITVGAGDVGSGLQVSGSFTLGAGNHGGVDVVVRSSQPGIMKLAPNFSTPGTDSIIVHLNDGQTSVGFYVQGVEGQTGAPSIQVSASGFTDGSTALNVVQPAIELGSLPSSITSGAADDAFWANIGIPNGAHTFMASYQALRAGSPGLTVTFTSGTPSVGVLTNSGGSGATRTAQIAAQISNTPTSVASGGVAFDPLTTGSTVVSAAASGFVVLPAASQVVTVTP